MLFYLLLVAGRVTSLFTRKVESALCFGTLKLDLPVRYLHIQLRHDSFNITESAGPLKTSVLGACRYRLAFHTSSSSDYFNVVFFSCMKFSLGILMSGGLRM